MTENTGSDSSSRLKKLIIIESVVCIIATLFGFYLIKRVDASYITLLMAITFISILAFPCTIGLFWHDLSLDTRKIMKFFVVFIISFSIMQEIFRLFQNRVEIIQVISSTLVFVIFIYLPFFIGRSIYTLRSRLHKA